MTRALTVVTVWQEVEEKLEKAYTADLERGKKRLNMLDLKHVPHKTALCRTRKSRSVTVAPALAIELPVVNDSHMVAVV